VRVDVVSERLGERARGWVDLVGTTLFLIPFSILMLWVSFPAVRTSWQIRETSPDPGGLPRWPIKALILVSFGLLLLQAASQIVRSLDVIQGSRADDGASEPEGHV